MGDHPMMKKDYLMARSAQYKYLLLTLIFLIPVTPCLGQESAQSTIIQFVEKSRISKNESNKVIVKTEGRRGRVVTRSYNATLVLGDNDALELIRDDKSESFRMEVEDGKIINAWYHEIGLDREQPVSQGNLRDMLPGTGLWYGLLVDQTYSGESTENYDYKFIQNSDSLYIIQASVKTKKLAAFDERRLYIRKEDLALIAIEYWDRGKQKKEILYSDFVVHNGSIRSKKILVNDNTRGMKTDVDIEYGEIR